MKKLTKIVSSGVAASLMVAAAGLTPAAAAEQISLSDVDVVERFEESVEGYSPGDPEAVLDLAIAGLDLALDESIADSLPASINISNQHNDSALSVGDSGDAHFIGGGTTVFTGVDTDLDMVHQEFAGGERFISVLGSDEAPTVQEYELDLPESAFLEMKADGSVGIYAEVAHEAIVPGEEERVVASVEEIIGVENLTFDDLENLSDEQIAALAAIPDPATSEVIITEMIGEVQTPWAVDAAGNQLETHFELQGTTLRQEVVVTDDTVFPVVADPNVLWWVWKVSSCIAGTATLVMFAPAKVATVAAKIYQILKFGKTSKLKAAFENWNYLGKGGKDRFALIAKHLKKFANDVTSTKGNFKLALARMSSTKSGHQVKMLMFNTGSTIVDLVGLKSCYDLYKEFAK